MRRIVALMSALVAIAAGAGFGAAKEKAAKPLDGYDGIVVRAFTIDHSVEGAVEGAIEGPIDRAPSTEGIPADFESDLQNRIVQDVLRARIFAHVVDASSGGNIELPDIRNGQVVNTPGVEDNTVRRVILDGAVTSYSKGNRAVRYAVGLGAGEAKLTVRFTLRDEKSGKQLQQFELKGTYKFGVLGGSENSAENQMSDSIGHRLVVEMHKSRSR